jgi:hypothetical protein
MEINARLAGAGRGDRMHPIPAAAALAWLAQRAIAPAGIAGISMAQTQAIVRSLFVDDVHPAELASWFGAIVTEASIRGQARKVGGAPPFLSAGLASSLRHLAWQFV